MVRGMVHGWMMWWGVGKLQWYTTWIGEVGLGHWGRSGLVVMVMVSRDLVWSQDVKKSPESHMKL